MTAPPTTKLTFSMAMKHFFGYRPGDKMQDFAAELKALTSNERGEFRKMLVEVGYTIEAPQPVTTK